MSNKELVIETLRKLPEDASLQQISEEIAILAGIQRGLEDVKAGRVITQEEMKKRSASWISR